MGMMDERGRPEALTFTSVKWEVCVRAMAFSSTLSGSAQSQLVPALTPALSDWERQCRIPGTPWEGSGHHPGHIISRVESHSFTGNPSPASIPDPGGRGSFLPESWKPPGPGLSWAEGQGMVTMTSQLGNEPDWPSGLANNVYGPSGDLLSKLWDCRGTKGAESLQVWKSEPAFVIPTLRSQLPSPWWAFMATTFSTSKSHTTRHCVHVPPIPVRFALQCPEEALVGTDRGLISRRR